jgi:hypothetical protein
MIRDLDLEIAKLEGARRALTGGVHVAHTGHRKVTRVLSADARKRIGDAQRQRWARQKAGLNKKQPRPVRDAA